MSENGEIYTADKNFTPPPALTALTNSTSTCFRAASAGWMSWVVIIGHRSSKSTLSINT